MNLFFTCIKIFFARLLDVSLGTFRTIMTIKEKNMIAAIIGFIEITIWFLVVKEALNTNNNSIFIVISYALGFSIGTYIGGIVSNKLIKSIYKVFAILEYNKLLIDKIKEEGYGLTIINTANNKVILYIETKEDRFIKLKRIITKYSPKAFITVQETKYVLNGYFSPIK